MNWLYMILIGALAGWIAEKVLKRDDSLLINLLAGIAGSIIGGYIFRFLGFGNMNGLLGSLITAVAGAILLLWIIAKVRSRS